MIHSGSGPSDLRPCMWRQPFSRAALRTLEVEPAPFEGYPVFIFWVSPGVRQLQWKLTGLGKISVNLFLGVLLGAAYI